MFFLIPNKESPHLPLAQRTRELVPRQYSNCEFDFVFHSFSDVLSIGRSCQHSGKLFCTYLILTIAMSTPSLHFVGIVSFLLLQIYYNTSFFSEKMRPV